MRGPNQGNDRRRQSPVGPPGIILVLTLLLVGLISAMSLTMINLASSDSQVATNESRSIQALFNADAGTEEAKMRLSPSAPTAAAIPVLNSASWRAYILSGRTQSEIQAGLDPAYGKAAPNYTATESTSDYFYYNTVQTGPNLIRWGWARVQHAIDSGGHILYQDAVTGLSTTADTQIVSGSTVYNPPLLIVTAEGIQGPVRRMIAPMLQPIVSTTTTTHEVVTDPFANALHARNTVELVGNAWTDSYNSSQGAYNHAGNRGHNGDVSTDSVTASAVTLNPNSTVDGDAIVGPGGDTATVINCAGTITGNRSVESSAMDMPLSTIPAGTTNAGPLSISGNRTVTLGMGTYWFSSISITGNGRLMATGPVVIYVTGNINIGGNGVATADNRPRNMLIYGTVDPANSANKTTTVSIHGNGDFYGAVYAPAAAIDTYGNGAVYGALAGNSAVVNGNGGFHYDEDLGNLGRFVTTSTGTTYTTTGYKHYSWREIAF